jgi:hypothetical protein
MCNLGLIEWKREKSYMCMIKGVLKNEGLRPHIHLKGWGLVKGTNGCCVVC